MADIVNKSFLCAFRRSVRDAHEYERTVEVQFGFTGLPALEGFSNLLFDPSRAIVGQECHSVPVVLGFEYGGNRDGIPLRVSDDVRYGIDVVRSLSISVK